MCSTRLCWLWEQEECLDEIRLWSHWSFCTVLWTCKVFCKCSLWLKGLFNSLLSWMLASWVFLWFYYIKQLIQRNVLFACKTNSVRVGTNVKWIKQIFELDMETCNYSWHFCRWKKKINSGAGFKYHPVNKVFLASAMQKCALDCWKQLHSCGESLKSDSSSMRFGSWNCLGCSDEIKVLDFSLTLQNQLWQSWGPLGPAGACPCWTGFPVSPTVPWLDLFHGCFIL